MKILVAEDDANTRDALREVLDREGFRVVTASNGREALDLFRKEKPDFICLDVMMPELNGYEVCNRIRREDESVPVLFLTAKSEEIEKVLGLELGADDYMTKPLGVKEVLARIRAILRRSGLLRKTGRDGAVFTMGDLEIHPAELRAIRGTQVIQLTLRDIHVLRVLYEWKGKVVERSRMSDLVWGVGFMPESRALDQHISQLRKRIEVDVSSPRIVRTVHGVGYRYEG
jgi:DNA-binding response OmpR family regulator